MFRYFENYNRRRHTQFCCGWSVEFNDFTTHVHILWMALSYRLRGEEECALRVGGTVGLHLGAMSGHSGSQLKLAVGAGDRFRAQRKDNGSWKRSREDRVYEGVVEWSEQQRVWSCRV